MKREYPLQPIPSAVIFRDEKVLIVKRAKGISRGKWSIPGGVVELGEKVRYHYILIDFLGKYKKGEVKLNSECLDAAWIARDELDKFELTGRARKVIEMAFKDF